MKAQASTSNAGLICVNKWASGIGIKPITVWRYRNRGWLNTVNIAGRVYVTLTEVERFTERAAAGEFAKRHKTPAKNLENR